jgi:hypothetical protein
MTCGTRRRLGSAKARLMEFHSAMIFSNPNDGSIASWTRWSAKLNSRHSLWHRLPGQEVSPGGKSRPPSPLLRRSRPAYLQLPQRRQQFPTLPTSAEQRQVMRVHTDQHLRSLLVRILKDTWVLSFLVFSFSSLINSTVLTRIAP